MDANQTTEGTTFERRFLPLPPWPNDLQAVRDEVFPDWYRCDELMTALDARVVVAHRAGNVVGYAQADDGLNQGSCYLR